MIRLTRAASPLHPRLSAAGDAVVEFPAAADRTAECLPLGNRLAELVGVLGEDRGRDGGGRAARRARRIPQPSARDARVHHEETPAEMYDVDRLQSACPDGTA